jgi:hypothetical protein
MLKLMLFLAVSCISILAAPLRADVLGDLAAECMAAVQAQDEAAFVTRSDAIMKRKDIFNTASRELAEQCLTLGFNEPWEYDFPSGEFLASATVEARLKAVDDAEFRKMQDEAKSKADAERMEIEREANADRVASMAYAACSILFDRDMVVAMTNAVCVDSFLANGLPAMVPLPTIPTLSPLP